MTPTVDDVRSELLFWICRDIARFIAGRTAVTRSLPFRRRDPRRARFAREEQLLRAIDPAWGARCRAEREELLTRYPYRDG